MYVSFALLFSFFYLISSRLLSIHCLSSSCSSLLLFSSSSSPLLSPRFSYVLFISVSGSVCLRRCWPGLLLARPRKKKKLTQNKEGCRHARAGHFCHVYSCVTGLRSPKPNAPESSFPTIKSQPTLCAKVEEDRSNLLQRLHNLVRNCSRFFSLSLSLFLCHCHVVDYGSVPFCNFSCLLHACTHAAPHEHTHTYTDVDKYTHTYTTMQTHTHTQSQHSQTNIGTHASKHLLTHRQTDSQPLHTNLLFK